jgi:hypothetical protein
MTLKLIRLTVWESAASGAADSFGWPGDRTRRSTAAFPC